MTCNHFENNLRRKERERGRRKSEKEKQALIETKSHAQVRPKDRKWDLTNTSSLDSRISAPRV